MSSSPKSSSPVFVVGCSRSGTTLVQSIIANHPDFTAFPETNLLYWVLNDLDYLRFGKLIGRRRIPASLLGRIVNNCGATINFSWSDLQRFLGTQAVSWSPREARTRVQSIRGIFLQFLELMEECASEKRWIEKSPQNIFCLRFIIKYFPDAHIVHIVRNAPDNVASLIDGGRKHADFSGRFGGPMGLHKAIHYYNASIGISAGYQYHPRNVVIRYEDLLSNPREALRGVEILLAIEFTSEMVAYNRSEARR